MRRAFRKPFGILATLLLIFQVIGADFAEAQRRGGISGNRWLSTPPINRALNRYKATQNKFTERRKQILTNRAKFQKQSLKGTHHRAFAGDNAQKIIPPASAFKQTKSLRAISVKKPLASERLAALKQKLQTELSQNRRNTKGNSTVVSLKEAKKQRPQKGSASGSDGGQLDEATRARVLNLSKSKEVRKIHLEGARRKEFQERGHSLAEVRAWVREKKIIGYGTDQRRSIKTDDGEGRSDTATVYGISKSKYVLINDRTGEISQAVGSQQAKAGEWVHDPRIKFLDGVD